MRMGFPSDRADKRATLLEAVEGVSDVLINCAAEAEQIATLSPAAAQALHEAGLFSLKLPAELGGAEADPVTQIEVIEAVSRLDAAAGWCVMIGATAISRPGAFLPDETIQQVFSDTYIPRASTVGTREGEGVPIDDGYLLNGRWSFASGIRHSEWLGVSFKSTRPDGSISHRSGFFPTAKAKIHDNWDVAGLRGTGSCDFSLTDVWVADAFTWDREVDLPKRGGPLYHLGVPGFVINEHVGFALGVGRRALDAVIDMAQTKKRGLQTSVLASRAVFQHQLAVCDLKLRAARALALDVYEAAWRSCCQHNSLEPRLQAELRSTATYVTEVAVDVATRAFRFGGGAALHHSHILQRCLRDLNAGAQHFMVNDSSYENQGQFMLGLPDANPMG